MATLTAAMEETQEQKGLNCLPPHSLLLSLFIPFTVISAALKGTVQQFILGNLLIAYAFWQRIRLNERFDCAREELVSLAYH